MAQCADSGSIPFFEEWNTPFGVPPFEKIKDDHYLPAFKRAIDEKQQDVKAITANKQNATFANTIEALDAAGELFERVENVFFNLTSAETNDRLEEVSEKVAPMISAMRDNIYLDQDLFARVKAVWDRRESLKLSAEQRRLLGETYKDFRRAGAYLGQKERQRLREINREFSILQVKFGSNLLKETNAFQLVIDDENDLAGLPGTAVAAAAEAAEEAGQSGKWIFTLHAPSYQPFISYADNRELRRKMVDAYISRCNHDNENDNKAILYRIATLRAEKSKLLGYGNFAEYTLEERMAKTPDKVYGLLNKLWKPALKVAHREADDMQKMINEQAGGFNLEAWDWKYYAEKVRKARFDLDENELRPYFSLDNVRDGAFGVASRLYGLTFTERTDIPKYHPEVRTFEVKEADGTHVGIFLADYHPRPGKRGGAWSSTYRGQQIKNGKNIRPVVVNVCNFTRPAEGKPALLRPEEVETLFHEFGHALHSLLRNIHYLTLASTPRDFVELPSQIMENWAMEPDVLRDYAKHYGTGEPIPAELVAKIKNASKFNQGFATVEYLAASFLDMDWHMITNEPPVGVNEFEKNSLDKINLMPEIITRYRSPYFQHIFRSSYAAGYYSYIWSAVLDTDAFQAFKEKGLFDRETAAAFRKEILERGNTADAMEMFVNFRGREPVVEPLLEKRGLND